MTRERGGGLTASEVFAVDRAVRASIPFDDTIALGCKPKGMWIIMGQPFITQPVEARRYWVARPGEEVLPFECQETAR